MREGVTIEDQIAAVLQGSGLEMERRREVAEELRGHLAQLADQYRAAGLPEARAIETALQGFGSPEIIRRQLRRQQRMEDRRRAVAEVRGRMRRVIIATASLGLAGGVLAPHAGSLAMRCIGGLCLFAWFCLFVPVGIYFGALLEYEAKRRRPREEFRFGLRFLRWTAVGVVVLPVTVAIAPLTVGVCAPLLGQNPLIDAIPWVFWHHWLALVLDGARYNVPAAAAAVLTFALCTALYERSRCVTGAEPLEAA